MYANKVETKEKEKLPEIKKIHYNIYKLIFTWLLYAKHAESDSSEATDDSLTNPPFRDKASKQKRDGSQSKTEDLAWRTSFQLRRFFKHNSRAWMQIYGVSRLLSLPYGKR